MSRRHVHITAGILALCLFLNRQVLAQAPRYYQVEDLGSFGGPHLVATAINNNGEVAGYGYLPDGAYHAFRWTVSGGLEDLGANGGSDSQALAINDNGDVTGVYIDPFGEVHGFIAPRGGPMRDLYSAAQRICCVNSITTDGRIAGMLLVDDLVSQAHAFRTVTGDTLQDLGGQFSSRAWDMNEHGDVTGVEVRNLSGMESAFRFSDGIGKVDLGTLGGPRSSGMSINNDGVVVGWSEAPIEPGYSWSARAFRARPGLPMEDLGTLVDGHFAVAASINDVGAIVGWSDTSWGARTAFVHTDAGGMVDLRSRMPATTDWPTLVSGIGINNSGQVAVLYDAAEGYGSFRLTPVADTHPPVISAAVAPAVLTPINLRMVTVNVAVTATDDYDPAPVCAIAHIANDEAWSLSKDFDVQITGPLTASLRAFRFPWGDGRTYTITVRCTDVSGNAGTADVVVTVPRNRPATR